jgi:hypothetical protein
MLNGLLNENAGFGIMGIETQTSTIDSGSNLPSVISDETNLNEEDEVKLSSKSIRTLFVAHIAEQLVNEEVDADDDLSKYGLMLEGKMTVNGKDWIKKFLPTLFAS